MYLSNLDMNHKLLFLDAAMKLAFSDGDFSSEEQTMMEMYCYEMGIEFPESFNERSLEEIISEIRSSCTLTEKKIFIFELVGLAVSDQNYDQDERKIISLMVNELGLDSKFAEKCESIILKYLEFQEQINSLVLGN